MRAVRKNRVASLGAAAVLVTGLTALGPPAWAQPNTPLSAEIYTSTGQFVDTITMASRNPLTGALDFFWNANDGAGGWGRSTVPASVSSEPALAVGDGASRIAVTSSSGSLDFYWNVNRTSAWNKVTVSGAGTAVGGPAMTRGNHASLIAAVHSDNSLWFTYNNDGSSGWPISRIDGSNTAFSRPAIAHFDGSTRVAVRGPNGALVFYWNVDGSGVWHKSVVTASGTANTEPVIRTHPGSGPFLPGTGIEVRTPAGGVESYHNWDGVDRWDGPFTTVGAGTAFSDPSTSVNRDGTVLAVQGLNHSLLLYWYADNGESGVSQVAGPGTTFTAPAVARGNSSTIVSARDANNRVIVYRNTDGSPTWTPTVAG